MSVCLTLSIVKSHWPVSVCECIARAGVSGQITVYRVQAVVFNGVTLWAACANLVCLVLTPRYQTSRNEDGLVGDVILCKGRSRVLGLGLLNFHSAFPWQKDPNYPSSSQRYLKLG